MQCYEFLVIKDRKILKEKISGFWNEEIARQYHKDFQNAVKPLLGKPWANYIDLRDWNPSNPKVMSILRDHLQWARSNMMEISANVVTTRIPKLQRQSMLQFGKKNLYYQFFEDEDSAFKWLESRGF